MTIGSDELFKRISEASFAYERRGKHTSLSLLVIYQPFTFFVVFG